MARLKDIVFDCDHAAGLARFWAAVMDGYAVAPYDEQEMAYLRICSPTTAQPSWSG